MQNHFFISIFSSLNWLQEKNIIKEISLEKEVASQYFDHGRNS